MPETEPLTFVGLNTDGHVLLTDGTDLYAAWPAPVGTPGWVGQKIDRDIEYGRTRNVNFCGAEIDMRQDEDHDWTEEVKLLGDRVAVTLNQIIRSTNDKIKEMP
jgi:hypothetical protein